MFENFPYTDMHQLNLDWIIKIAKDFLDQYTHIQQLIADGEESLQNLTEEGLTQLQDKADTLEGLLQAWYDTHSEDIATQLASALSDLNDWYTTHSNDIATELTSALSTLNNQLTTNINAFNTAADQKAAQTIATIPDDYTALSNKVLDLIFQNGIILPNGYYVNGRTILTNEIQAGDIIYYSFDAYSGRYGFIAFMDSNNTQISYIGKGSAGSGALHYDGFYTVPANYDHLDVQATGTTGLTIQVISTPFSNRALYNFIDNITITENSVWG